MHVLEVTTDVWIDFIICHGDEYVIKVRSNNLCHAFDSSGAAPYTGYVISSCLGAQSMLEDHQTN